MQFTLDIHSPSHTRRLVSDDELAGVYDSLGDDSVITWNDGSDKDLLITSVHTDFSTVSLRHEDTWHWLVRSDDASLVDIVLCGLEAWVPAGPSCLGKSGLLPWDLSPMSLECSASSGGGNSDDASSSRSDRVP